MVVRRYFERQKKQACLAAGKAQGTRYKAQERYKGKGTRNKDQDLKEEGKTKPDTKFNGSLPHRGNMLVGV